MHVADAVKQYAVDLVTATREAPDLRLGASPRATLQLLRTARAVAALEGRDYVLPDDLQALAVPVLAHRIIPTAEAQLGRRTTDAIVAELVHRLPLPHDRQRVAVRHPARHRQRSRTRTSRGGGDVRDGLRGLTTRGRSFLAAAVAAALSAVHPRREGPAPGGRAAGRPAAAGRRLRRAAAGTSWPAPARWTRTGCRSAPAPG